MNNNNNYLISFRNSQVLSEEQNTWIRTAIKKVNDVN